jgi:hypothetical protein
LTAYLTAYGFRSGEVQAPSTATDSTSNATGRTTPFVRPPGEYQEPDGFTDGAWQPSDSRFVTAYGGLVQIWDPHTAGVLGDNHQHQLTCDIVDLDYTADGSRIVVGSAAGDMIMLDANLEPVGRPVFLGESTRCTSAGPDNKTAFVLVGGAPGPASPSFEFADSMNGWALVDLDAGVVLRREEPGISLFWGRGPCRRMADAPPSAAPRARCS